jgi:excisionase family DNA binding protein
MPTNPASPDLRAVVESDPAYLMEVQAAQAGSSGWLSVKETAAYLGRSVRQVRRYQADGEMPERKKRGRERLYPLSELEKIKSSLD